MDDRKVPMYIFEGVTARFERVNKRLVIAMIITIILLFLSNLAWLWYINQYDFISEESTVTVDAKDGIANYIGQNGDITNGNDSSEKSSSEQSK